MSNFLIMTLTEIYNIFYVNYDLNHLKGDHFNII